MMVSDHLAGALTALAVAFILYYVIKARKGTKPRKIGQTEERVLIIGASSGLGRTLARHYGVRGARVCIVARRSAPLFELAGECGPKCLPIIGDFTDAAAMDRVREGILRQWSGLDTMHVCAGVSAVQPVMALTGIRSSNEDAPVTGIQRAAEMAGLTTQGNFVGPLMAALAFIPMLKRTSDSPAILLVSSVAAVIPAPTRALYAATKAASLLLFQSLAIEHPEIAFTCVLPATIQGNFRSSAIDADPNQRTGETNKKGLSVDYVAGRCIDAVDRGLRGNVVIPWFPYQVAHHLYHLWPSFIEKKARRKYDFTTR
jgi:NAD(P)-dependent dehydrogenase (short-subunit alcohol dehydrogenase family)